MKAVILAAGEGIRLRPLTLTTPKCLINVSKKPLLEHWLDKCKNANIEEVFINGYYLFEQIEAFIENIKGNYPFKINLIKEDVLTGSGGFLKKISNILCNEEFFFFCHGDNFTNLDINKFVSYHRKKNSSLTIAMFECQDNTQCGIIENIDDNGLIKIFKEKPKHSNSYLASAAIFLASPKVLQKLSNNSYIDFSKEILPQFQNNMYGYKIEGFNIDIGTIENLEKANRQEFFII